MTDLHHLSDRMPGVAIGHARWSVDDERHLAACEACRREWDLIRQTVRLGAGYVAQLDEPAIAAAVLDRLRVALDGASPIAPRGRNWRLVGLGGTVAAVIAAGAILVARDPTPSHRTPPVVGREQVLAREPIETGLLELPMPELDDVPLDALDTVLQVLDRPFRADELLDSTWSDGDGRELEPGLGTISTPEG